LPGLAAFAAMAALLFGGAAVCAAAQFDARDSRRLVAVFPPWWSNAEALAAASATAAVAGVGGVGFAVGVIADRPGVARELKRRGALFVFDGRKFPACFSSLKATDP
jgi:hypothetical protein